MIQLIKDQWVNKLKSGQFNKCQRLYRGTEPNTFCSIGLLLNVLDAKGWYRVGTLWCHTISVYDGLSDNKGVFFEKTGLTVDDFHKVCNLNDHTKMSLLDIGEWVDTNL